METKRWLDKSKQMGIPEQIETLKKKKWGKKGRPGELGLGRSKRKAWSNRIRSGGKGRKENGKTR